MRIACPCCGTRDRREYTYYGAADYLNRPASEADDAAWDEYLHLRDNPAGPTRDLWYHDPCGTWVEVSRNTLTHDIMAVRAIAGGAS